MGTVLAPVRSWIIVTSEMDMISKIMYATDDDNKAFATWPFHGNLL